MHDNSDVPTTYDVAKYAAQIPISEEMLIDMGLSDGPSKFPEYHPTRLHKIRWYLSLTVASIRLRIGSWIAGVDLRDHDDW